MTVDGNYSLLEESADIDKTKSQQPHMQFVPKFQIQALPKPTSTA